MHHEKHDDAHHEPHYETHHEQHHEPHHEDYHEPHHQEQHIDVPYDLSYDQRSGRHHDDHDKGKEAFSVGVNKHYKVHHDTHNKMQHRPHQGVHNIEVDSPYDHGYDQTRSGRRLKSYIGDEKQSPQIIIKKPHSSTQEIPRSAIGAIMDDIEFSDPKYTPYPQGQSNPKLEEGRERDIVIIHALKSDLNLPGLFSPSHLKEHSSFRNDVSQVETRENFNKDKERQKTGDRTGRILRPSSYDASKQIPDVGGSSSKVYRNTIHNQEKHYFPLDHVYHDPDLKLNRPEDIHPYRIDRQKREFKNLVLSKFVNQGLSEGTDLGELRDLSGARYLEESDGLSEKRKP